MPINKESDGNIVDNTELDNVEKTSVNNNTKSKIPTLKSNHSLGQRRLSRWFVTNQKTDTWDENRLNTLHFTIIISLIIMYVCHILASPFIKFIENTTAIIIICGIEVLCIIFSISCLVNMLFVNGSLAATKMIFDKKNARTYIYIFWIARSFVIEFLKGQILYSFVHVFHSVVIYSSDMWYICNRKYLIGNILLFLFVLIYEFFVSISPAAPSEPS